MDEQGPVKKRVVNLGIGGSIEAPGALVDVEERSIVTISARARYGAVKRKFEDDGSVSESIILTVEADSFKVLDVAAPPPIPEQGTLDDEAGDSAGPED